MKQGLIDVDFFMYGFAKNTQANINETELKALKLLSFDLLHKSAQGIQNAIHAGEIIEVIHHG